jgi:hypothetical protein
LCCLKEGNASLLSQLQRDHKCCCMSFLGRRSLCCAIIGPLVSIPASHHMCETVCVGHQTFPFFHWPVCVCVCGPHTGNRTLAGGCERSSWVRFLMGAPFIKKYFYIGISCFSCCRLVVWCGVESRSHLLPPTSETSPHPFIPLCLNLSLSLSLLFLFSSGHLTVAWVGFPKGDRLEMMTNVPAPVVSDEMTTSKKSKL